MKILCFVSGIGGTIVGVIVNFTNPILTTVIIFIAFSNFFLDVICTSPDNGNEKKQPINIGGYQGPFPGQYQGQFPENPQPQLILNSNDQSNVQPASGPNYIAITQTSEATDGKIRINN